ncbi:hypothetical protein R3P38DRAFT_2792361 [Favolaschia claudopus]|uniref:Uncharacterized protein n=1 Tax=Favolaschia claudopus TaxID=2862362 RepID=A0AAW0AEV1_9AGAR
MFGISYCGPDIDDRINISLFRSLHLISLSSLKARCPRSLIDAAHRSPVQLIMKSFHFKSDARITSTPLLLALKQTLKSLKVAALTRWSPAGIIKFALTIRIDTPRAPFQDLAAGRLTPPPTRKAACSPLFNASVVVEGVAAAPRSGAHNFDYMDRRPASGTFKCFSRRQASTRPRHIEQRVLPPLAKSSRVAVATAAPRRAAYLDYVDSQDYSTLSRRQAISAPDLSSSNTCRGPKFSFEVRAALRIASTQCIVIRRAPLLFNLNSNFDISSSAERHLKALHIFSLTPDLQIIFFPLRGHFIDTKP